MPTVYVSDSLTMIPLSPLAPPPLSAALKQISSKALLLNLISTFEYPKSAVYCDKSDPLTSVRTFRKSWGVSGDSVAKEGSREMNSGMNPYLTRSKHIKETVRQWRFL